MTSSPRMVVARSGDVGADREVFLTTTACTISCDIVNPVRSLFFATSGFRSPKLESGMHVGSDDSSVDPAKSGPG